MSKLKYGIFLLIFLSLFIENTLINLPLVFALSVAVYILFPDNQTLIVVFLAGLIVDILKVLPSGLTLIALAVCFILINLYRNSFELKEIKMMLLIVVISSFIYSRLL